MKSWSLYVVHCSRTPLSVCRLHKFVPVFVNVFIFLQISLPMLISRLIYIFSDISWKQILKIKPISLTFSPLFQSVINEVEAILHFLSFSLQSFDISRANNEAACLQWLIEGSLNRIDAIQLVCFFIDSLALIAIVIYYLTLMFHEHESFFLPLCSQGSKRLVQVRLLCGSDRYVHDLICILCYIEIDQVSESEFLLLQVKRWNIQDGFDLLPMHIGKLFVGKRFYRRHGRLEVEHHLFEILYSCASLWQVAFAQ